MSASEIPILDPKNIIVRGYGPGTEYAGSLRKNVYDPVAKLILVLGRTWQEERDQFSYGVRECRIVYAPEYTPELFDEPMTQQQWDRVKQLGMPDTAIKIARRSLGMTVKGKIYLYVAKLISFQGIGVPNEDAPWDRILSSDHGGDLKYKFWPDGVSDKNKRAAPYFLRMFFAYQYANASWAWSTGIEAGDITHCGIAIDQALADFMGLEQFPDAERLDDDLILVLKGDVRNAG